MVIPQCAVFSGHWRQFAFPDSDPQLWQCQNAWAEGEDMFKPLAFVIPHTMPVLQGGAETPAGGTAVTCPGPHSQQVAESRLEPRLEPRPGTRILWASFHAGVSGQPLGPAVIVYISSTDLSPQPPPPSHWGCSVRSLLFNIPKERNIFQRRLLFSLHASF